VQFEDKKTRCTVVWVLDTGPVKKNQVGVKLVAGQDCPWEAYLPVDGPKARITDSNRRRWSRHKISLPLEIRDERVSAPARINATDVSGNGCYVESMQPMALGTVLRLDFWLGTEHINVSAVVRTYDPGVGNGIEFTGMSAEVKERMQSYLDSIDPEVGSRLRGEYNTRTDPNKRPNHSYRELCAFRVTREDDGANESTHGEFSRLERYWHLQFAESRRGYRTDRREFDILERIGFEVAEQFGKISGGRRTGEGHNMRATERTLHEGAKTLSRFLGHDGFVGFHNINFGTGRAQLSRNDIAGDPGANEQESLAV